MGYKVGSLDIAFETVDKTASDFSNLKKNLQALQRVIKNIANIDMGKFVGNVDKLHEHLSPLLADINGAGGAIAGFNDIVKTIGVNNISKAAADFNNIRQATEEAENSTKEFNVTAETSNKILSENIQILNEVNEQLNNNERATKKGASGWSKFIKSIGRIALYRAIRGALQLITQSITYSIQEFSKVDDNANATMSSITSSLKVIQLSFGATFLPILQAIDFAVSQIAIEFANVANVISASMATGDTYWAINARAIQDYREQLQKTTSTLASFDKIQSLNQKDTFSFLEERSVESLNEELGLTKINYQGIYFLIRSIGELLGSVLSLVNKIGQSTTVRTIIGVISWVVGGLAKAVSWLIDILAKSGLIEPILGAILGVLIAIGVTKIITWLSGGKIIEWLLTLALQLGATKNRLVSILGTTQALGASIGALSASIFYFISSLDKMGATAKWLVPLIAGVLGVVVALMAVLVGKTPIKTAITAGLLTAAVALAVGTASSVAVQNARKSQATPMAKGGIPSVGTLFYAGEAGAETVTVGSSGRTEVTNVSQMETALYNALVRYGRENCGSDSAINVNIDGQKVFEATRRVANRKGLDFSRV